MILSTLWRYKAIIFIGLILCVTWFYKARYEAISSEYEAFKAKQSALVEAAKKENAAIKKAGAILAQTQKAQYDAELKRQNLNRDKIKGQLNETINQLAIFDSTIRLRNQSSVSALPKVPTTSGTSASGGGDHAIVENLIDAAKLCAIDYNALMTAWRDNCELHGCE